MQSDSQVIELLGHISDDVQSIRVLLARLSRDSFAKDLDAVASTPERQEMWRLADGTRNTEEIGKGSGSAIRSVQYFLQEAEKKGLIIYVKRGYPKRAEYFDEIPSTWKSIRKQQLQTSSSTEEHSSGELNNEQQ
jgi:hypothetical protein